MGEKDRQIVQELKRRLPAEVVSHLSQLIMYGSRARGEAAEDSDLDLVALVDEKTPELEAQMEEVAYRVMWDHDFKPIISLKVFDEGRFRSAAQKGYSFYRNVEREGIEL
jgi:predicted nucleotidyltransferase